MVPFSANSCQSILIYTVPTSDQTRVTVALKPLKRSAASPGAATCEPEAELYD